MKQDYFKASMLGNYKVIEEKECKLDITTMFFKDCVNEKRCTKNVVNLQDITTSHPRIT